MGDMDWNHLAWGRDQRHTLVDTVVKYRIHKMLGIEVSEQLLPSQEVLCSMELFSYAQIFLCSGNYG
jgi:hypothetical protein